MALSSAAEYKTAIFKIFRTLPRDLDIETWIRVGGMTRADANQLLSEYNTYRGTLGSRINQARIEPAVD